MAAKPKRPDLSDYRSRVESGQAARAQRERDRAEKRTEALAEALKRTRINWRAEHARGVLPGGIGPIRDQLVAAAFGGLEEELKRAPRQEEP